MFFALKVPLMTDFIFDLYLIINYLLYLYVLILIYKDMIVEAV